MYLHYVFYCSNGNFQITVPYTSVYEVFPIGVEKKFLKNGNFPPMRVSPIYAAAKERQFFCRPKMSANQISKIYGDPFNGSAKRTAPSGHCIVKHILSKTGNLIWFMGHESWQPQVNQKSLNFR